MRRTLTVLKIKGGVAGMGGSPPPAIKPKKQKLPHMGHSPLLRGVENPKPSNTRLWIPEDFNVATVKELGKTRVVRSWRHMRERAAVLRWTTPPSRLNRKYALGYVPTMGGLHDGHLALIEASQAECVFTAVSIFVNPTQFGAGEDLATYPSSLKRDLQILAEAQVDAVFMPTPEQIYPPGYRTYLDYEGVDQFSEAKTRPTHFRGVATVCNQLFNIMNPNAVYIGQKDAVQCVVLRSLVRDMKMNIDVVVCPTVREIDGLACSTRNVNLDAEQRREARMIFLGLDKVNAHVRNLCLTDQRKGGLPLPKVAEVKNMLRAEYNKLKLGELEYIEIGEGESMTIMDDEVPVEQGSFLSVVVRYGSTRLLDNIRLGCDVEEYWRQNYEDNTHGIRMVKV